MSGITHLAILGCLTTYLLACEEGSRERAQGTSANPDAGGQLDAALPPNGEQDGSRPSPDPDGAVSPEQDSGPLKPMPNAHCAPTETWDPKYTQLEEEVLVLVNKARAAGHDCGSQGVFKPTHALKMEPRLRCAARLHSKYMGETKDYGHVTKAGVNFDKRINDTGYPSATVSENIAAGARSAAEVMGLWLDSDGHCRNIMWPDFTEIGIGHATDNADDPYFGPYPYWTQNFGKPL